MPPPKPRAKKPAAFSPAAKLSLTKWAEISRSALRENFRRVSRRLRRPIVAVVKADGYGHGILETAEIFLDARAKALGVVSLAEAEQIWKHHPRAPIWVLGPVFPSEIRRAVRRPSGVFMADELSFARALSRSARSPVQIQIEVDYGLRRWGVAPENLEKLARGIARLPRLRLIGAYAHLPYEPGKNPGETESALEDFEARAARLSRMFPGISTHVANSTVALDFPVAGGVARIGNLLYGFNPAQTRFSLRPAFRAFARIAEIRELPAGARLGYGGEFVAGRKMRIASIPLGYADGLTVEPLGRRIQIVGTRRWWAKVRGKPAPLVGTVGITHSLWDLTQIPSARAGDIAEIPMKRLSSRLPRIFV